MLYHSILETIGNTPLINCQKLKKYYGLKGNIYGKAEFYNPTFSKKDRIAYYIIKKAKEEGILKEGQAVVEATSGNTGIALSAVCAYLGHPFYAVISEGNSKERLKIMEMYGTKLVIMKQEDGSYGKVSGNDFDRNLKKAKELEKELNAFFVNQFGNPWNIEAQSLTAHEIINDINSYNLNINIFCDFIGTGGSYQAISTILKKTFKEIECNIVEPKNCCPYFQFKQHNNLNYEPKPHSIQGGGYGKTNFPVLNNIEFDNSILISDEEVYNMMKIISKEEGIFASFSSAANCLATIKCLQKWENQNPNLPPKNGLFIFCDTGMKYLSNL